MFTSESVALLEEELQRYIRTKRVLSMSFCLSTPFPFEFSIHRWSCQSVGQSVCMPTCRSFCLSVCLFICLSASLSFLHLFFYAFDCFTISTSSYYLARVLLRIFSFWEIDKLILQGPSVQESMKLFY